MTVGNFLDLCTDDVLNVEIHSVEKYELVWSGYAYNVPDKYRNTEVSSWDVPMKKYHITINID